jgi:ribosomal protein L18E
MARAAAAVRTYQLSTNSKDEPARRSVAKLLTKRDARRIAANVAKLPDVLHKPGYHNWI